MIELTTQHCPWCNTFMNVDYRLSAYNHYALHCYNCGAMGPTCRTKEEALKGRREPEPPKKSDYINELYTEMCCGHAPWED